MLALPAPVLDYLFTTTIANRSPAYLFISKDGYLRDWGGQLSMYGISNLHRGETVSSQVCFLEGLLPLNGTELFLPRIHTDQGICTDVYLFSDAEGDWVLLLDATLDEFQHSLLQQCRNDLNLLQTRQAQLLSQQIGRATKLPPTLLPDGEHKNLTILFAALREFMTYSKHHPSRTVFRALNLYLRSMIQAIVSETGIVDTLVSNEVRAWFGVLSMDGSTASHAIQAALKMLESVQDINQLRQSDNQSIVTVGIGIASGPTALGVLGDHHHRTLGAIGHAVNLAATLQQQANAGEVLIDADTFNQARQMQHQFSAVDRVIAGLTEPIQIYSFMRR